MEEVIFNRSDIPATYDGLHYKTGKILAKPKNITKFVMLYECGKKENRPKNDGVSKRWAASVLKNEVKDFTDLYVIHLLTAQN